MTKYVNVGSENVKMEECIHQFASTFTDLNLRLINNGGYRKTQIKKFLTEEKLQRKISREKLLMNVMERMKTSDVS